MTHFQRTVKRLDAVEYLLWMLLLVMGVLLLSGHGQEEELRFRVKADNNSEQAQLDKEHLANQLLQSFELPTTPEEVLYPPKRSGFGISPQGVYKSVDVQIGDGRGDNFWCILVKNSCYDEEDVKQPKSFFVMVWKRWFSTDDGDSSPQDGDKISLQEG
ncbi:stage II sporulation protein R [Chryseomicrobium sp. FSL W7-1435]|uniref:stage II sporulation protein R n=1 Tax=Chryseomicrobium sp. FSL W7-1435 TaxID=2921704 RepID=UPI00315A92A8